MTGDDEFARQENARFATEVIEVFRAAIADEAGPPTRKHAADVRRAALGLAALKQLVDRDMQRLRSDPDRLNETGIFEADAIIDALTTGREHPIWRHIRALQAKKSKRGSMPPVAREQERRDRLAGIVLAYKKRTDVNLSAAVRSVHKAISSEDCPFTHGQLLTWVNRASEAAQNFARQFLRYEAEVPQEITDPGKRILIVGQVELRPYLTVPAIEASRPLTIFRGPVT